MPEPRSINDILTALNRACDGDSVSVDQIFDEIGHRSFAPALLVPALLLVSPISGIPGVPTVGSIIIFFFAVQAIIGTDHLWLPGFIRKRNMPCSKLSKALIWLQKPADWIDERTERRLSVLARWPWHNLAYVAMIALAMIMPFLEILPMVTSVACFSISLLALGIMVRDGLLVLLGYLCIGAFGLLVLSLTRTVTGG
nr:exopolysaccharide biosynthesis protein [uncultured Celeribacter sp.]